MSVKWSGRLVLAGVTWAIFWLGATVGADVVGHWTFDEIRKEGCTPNSGAGGSVLNGKLVGDARLQSNVSDGVLTRASALALDGDGDWVRIDHPVTTLGDQHSFTVAAWVKTRASKTALRRAASVPEFPTWTDKGILDFNRVVQPVLDDYCVECHAGPTPEAAVDLSSDKTHFFNMAYDQLLDRGLVHYIPVAGTDHAESAPNTRGAVVSRIREHIETDHSGQVLPAEARHRIYTWIDANVPYYGTYEVTDRRVVGGRDRWYVGDPNGWFQKAFLPVFNRRCMPCHQRYVTPQTYNYNPGGNGKILVSSRLWTDTALRQFQLGHGRISFTGRIRPSHKPDPSPVEPDAYCPVAEGSRRAGVVPAPARAARTVCRQERSRLSGNPLRIDARARETSGEPSRRYACRHRRGGQGR